jgi:peptidyl-prolyl cis-trans isomerase C
MKRRSAQEPPPGAWPTAPRATRRSLRLARAALGFSGCLALLACDAPTPSRAAPPPPASGSLQAGVVARVGDVSITADEVARIAAAQGLSPAEARDLAIHDALLASEARARGVEQERSIDLAATGILARALIQDLAAAAEAQGPVTDAELDAVTARHWTELDRPDAARTVHAVVMVKKDAPADVRAKASALAETIRKSLASAADAAQHSEPPKPELRAEDPAVAAFRKAASAVPKGDFDVRIEPLNPVVADGRTFSEGMRYEESFGRAALQLAHRGDVTPVFETSFGYHVALLLERIPGHVVPREERRAMVRDEVMTTRARAARDQLLASLRTRAAIGRNTDAHLALVPVEPQ